MEDSQLPQSLGVKRLSSLKLSPKQEMLCDRLDALCAVHGLVAKPSDMFRGAIFAIRPECRNNPDWIAQSANSLREALYPFYSAHVKKIVGSRGQILSEYGSVRVSDKWIGRLGSIYGKIEGLAHHGNVEKNHVDFPEYTDSKFESLMKEFEDVVFEVLARQIDVHKEIDLLLQNEPTQTTDCHQIQEILELNPDAHEYFFSKANDLWLGWLWDNRFLDVIKKKSEDPTKYSYTMPELDYLVKVSESKSKEVTDIILLVPVTKETFNPEVVDRFLHIAGKLPADDLIRVIQKIHDENWVRLMGAFNRWGFEYKSMFDTLAKAQKHDSVLALAEVVLSVRTEEERKKTDNGFGMDNPFYFGDLSDTEILEHLVSVDSVYGRDALRVLSRALGAVAIFGSRDTQDSVFSMGETFFLFDVDFFTLKFDEKERVSSPRDSVRELAAATALFLQKLLVGCCDDEASVRTIYDIYVKSLPDTRAMWRLRLFVFSLCPNIFKEEIRTELFRIFSTEKYGEFLMGAEYERLAQSSFSVLDVADRKEYIQKAINLFGKEENPYIGNGIFSSILPFLTDEEKSDAEATLGSLKESYVPEPSIVDRGGFAGSIVSRPPGGDDEWTLPIPEIIHKLKNEWSPHKLTEKYSENRWDDEDSFHHPIDANGTGNRIKSELKKRTTDYINQAELFFDRERLHPHYTYSFLQGVHDLLREKSSLEEVDLSHVLTLFRLITESGEKVSFAKKDEDTGHVWTANWSSVHRAMTDVLDDLLSGEAKDLRIDFLKNRALILSFIQYLLKDPNPSVENEKTEYHPERKEYTGFNPYDVAINSVRGAAFESFTYFLFRDGERLKESGKKIEDDTKALFEKILASEKTQAMFFLFGRNLPSLYFRDILWAQGLLPKIFPSDPLMKDLYFAAWEGYLSNNLYQEMFHDTLIQELYKRNIFTSQEEYTKRRYFREIDEGLATHLALAFVHYDDFTFDSPLFNLFWETKSILRHKEFISFVGRYGISRDADSVISEEHLLSIEKLKKFWEWVIDQSEPEALDGFGYWINPNKDFFNDDKWLAKMLGETLKKSEGGLDWEYGLMERLPVLALAAPSETLVLLSEYFLGKRNQERQWFRADEKLQMVFRTLSENPETNKQTGVLVNDLISRYGRRFWELKDSLK